jgi:hypothetical protein
MSIGTGGFRKNIFQVTMVGCPVSSSRWYRIQPSTLEIFRFAESVHFHRICPQDIYGFYFLAVAYVVPRTLDDIPLSIAQ